MIDTSKLHPGDTVVYLDTEQMKEDFSNFEDCAIETRVAKILMSESGEPGGRQLHLVLENGFTFKGADIGCVFQTKIEMWREMYKFHKKSFEKMHLIQDLECMKFFRKLIKKEGKKCSK